MPEIKVVISAENKQALEAIQQVLTASKSASDGVDTVGGQGKGVKVATEGVMSLKAALSQITKAANNAADAIERAGGTMADAMNKGAVGAKNLNNALGKTVSAAKATTAAVKETGTGLNSSLGDVERKTTSLASALSRATDSAKGLGGGARTSFKEGEGAADGFSLSLGGIAGKIAALVGAVYSLKQLLAPGFNFVMNMQSAQLGIAGTLMSMTLLDGKAVDFNTAMQISTQTMKQLQKEAAKTAATTEELVTVFQAILAPAVGSGMKMDEIIKLTSVGANAVKAIMPNNVDKQRQMVQEIRDLVQGGIQASSSTLATALGLTDADIDRARKSSEGLFKFLMKRLEGFADVSEHYPDIIQGKLDLLSETAQRASAAFTEAFEGELGTLLDFVTSLFGELDKKTGDFKPSPAIAAALELVKDQYQNLKEVIEILSPVMERSSQEFEDIKPILKDFWGIIKDITSIIKDMARVFIAAVTSMQDAFKPVRDYLTNEFTYLTHQVKEFTGYLKEAWDYFAKISGAKKPTAETSMADFTKMQDTNNQPPIDTSKLTQKFEDQKKLVQESQAALKAALDSIDEDAKRATVSIDSQIKELNVAYSMDPSKVPNFYQQMANLEAQKQQIQVDKAASKLARIGDAMYEKDTDKNVALTKAQNDLDTETAKLTESMKGLNDVTKNTTSSFEALPEQAGMEDKGLRNTDENTKNMAYMVGSWLKSTYGLSPEVSGGWRSPENNAANNGSPTSWHLQGKAIDINVGEIDEAMAAQIKEYAQQFFDEVLYHDVGSGLHLHLGNPKEGAASFQTQFKTQFGAARTDLGLKMYKEYMEMAKEVDDMAKEALEEKGDLSSGQRTAINLKYNDLINKYRSKGRLDWVAVAENAKQLQLNKVDFDQEKRNLSDTFGQLTNEARIYFEKLQAGAISGTEAIKGYADTVFSATAEDVKKLRKMLASEKAAGHTARANEIQAELDKIPENVLSFLEKVVQELENQLSRELALIEANPHLSNFQKEDAKNAANDKYGKAIQNAYNNAADMVRQSGAPNAETLATTLEKQGQYNAKIKETASLLDQVHEAGRNAFENGLFNWLTEGVLKAQSLGDAIREMAISILTDINKIFAKKVTTNIMASLGFATGGYVSGPGTGTSDSIPARLSNGEVVIRASSVRKFGAGFFNMLNHGIMPPVFGFADGGYVNIGGASDVATSFQAGDQSVKVVNVTDPNEVGRFMLSAPGERVFINMVTKHAGVLRKLLK